MLDLLYFIVKNDNLLAMAEVVEFGEPRKVFGLVLGLGSPEMLELIISAGVYVPPSNLVPYIKSYEHMRVLVEAGVDIYRNTDGTLDLLGLCSVDSIGWLVALGMPVNNEKISALLSPRTIAQLLRRGFEFKFGEEDYNRLLKTLPKNVRKLFRITQSNWWRRSLPPVTF